MKKLQLEIAICTWNRANQLAATLHSISKQSIPSHVDLSLIVINNNSTDHTAEVIREFSSLPVISVVERQQGHAFARNTAIKHARSDWLIWTDDDVNPHDQWISAYVDAIDSFPGATFFGGPIIPVFPDGCPTWVTENWDKLKGCYAERKLGDQAFEFSKEVLPYGANFAIRTEVQKAFPFDLRTGRKTASVVGDDELDMLRRVLKHHSGYWIPKAGLDHIIDPTRRTARYVRAYFVGQGKMMVKNGRNTSTDLQQLKREWKWNLACSRLKRPFSNSDTWVSHLIRSALAEGQYSALQNV